MISIAVVTKRQTPGRDHMVIGLHTIRSVHSWCLVYLVRSVTTLSTTDSATDGKMLALVYLCLSRILAFALLRAHSSSLTSIVPRAKLNFIDSPSRSSPIYLLVSSAVCSLRISYRVLR